MLTLDANIWIAVYDPKDVFHAESTAFLVEVTRQQLRVNGPDFVLIETACALARRAQDPSVGQTAAQHLQAHPLLTLYPFTDHLFAAIRLGVQQLLRGGDAIYVATAQLSGAQLISWDAELVRRAGAITPTDWLAQQEGNRK
jgi:predicted nucleic acid-binding protein